MSSVLIGGRNPSFLVKCGPESWSWAGTLPRPAALVHNDGRNDGPCMWDCAVDCTADHPRHIRPRCAQALCFDEDQNVAESGSASANPAEPEVIEGVHDRAQGLPGYEGIDLSELSGAAPNQLQSVTSEFGDEPRDVGLTGHEPA